MAVDYSSNKSKSVQQRKQRIPLGMVVFFGFALALGMGVLLIYVLGRLPSPEEGCRSECATKNRSGRLVNTYPPQMVSSDTKNPKKCECY